MLTLTDHLVFELDASRKQKELDLNDEDTAATETMDFTWDTSQRSRSSWMGSSANSRSSRQLNTSNHSVRRSNSSRSVGHSRGRPHFTRPGERADSMGGSLPCQSSGSFRRQRNTLDSLESPSCSRRATMNRRPASARNVMDSDRGGLRRRHSSRNAGESANPGSIASVRRARSARNVLDSSLTGSFSSSRRARSARNVTHGAITISSHRKAATNSQIGEESHFQDTIDCSSHSVLNSFEEESVATIDECLANHLEKEEACHRHQRCSFKPLDASFGSLNEQDEELTFLDLSNRASPKRKPPDRRGLGKQWSEMGVSVRNISVWMETKAKHFSEKIEDESKEPHCTSREYAHTWVETPSHNLKAGFLLPVEHGPDFRWSQFKKDEAFVMEFMNRELEKGQRQAELRRQRDAKLANEHNRISAFVHKPLSLIKSIMPS